MATLFDYYKTVNAAIESPYPYTARDGTVIRECCLPTLPASRERDIYQRIEKVSLPAGLQSLAFGADISSACSWRAEPCIIGFAELHFWRFLQQEYGEGFFAMEKVPVRLLIEAERCPFWFRANLAAWSSIYALIIWSLRSSGGKSNRHEEYKLVG